jgi:hypothetical protein
MDNFPIDKLRLNEAVVALRGKLDEIGDVKLLFSNDVEELERAHIQLGKECTGEHFRRALDTLPPNRMFWLCAELEGDVIGTVAARYDESSWSLQKFVKNYWERVFDAEGVADECGGFPKVRFANEGPEAAAEYKGRFAYLGEAITRPDKRSRNLSIVLVRLALLFAFDEWRPTVAYGWMRDWHAYRGLHTRWGFNKCDLNAFDWRVRPRETDWHNLAFLTCNLQGFQSLLKNPAPDEAFRTERSSSEGNGSHPTPEQEESGGGNSRQT